MSAEYSIWLLHPAYGYPLKLIDQFISLTYTKVVNNYGAFSLTLPSSFDISLVQADTRIVIYRKPSNGARTIDFAGFVRKIDKPTQDFQYYVLSGFDLNDLLRRRIVAYASGTSQADKTDQADDMCKAIVRENLGASAIAARDLSAYGLTVEADQAQCTSISKAFSWRTVLTVLQEIAEASHSSAATPAYFHIVPLNTGWECEFRTNVQQWGMDHRFPSGPAGVVMFSLELANIVNVQRTIDYSSEVNYAYAGGQGEGAARNIQESSDATRIGVSPFNRCELFVDARNSTTNAQVLDAARSGVRNGKPKDIFQGTILDVNQVYGRDWGFGDYVTGVYLGEQIDCRIDAITVAIDNGAESVQAILRKGE